MDKINFQDIQAQHLNRYQVEKVEGEENVVDLTPVRGTVTQAGTPLRAQELNQMQENIDAAKVDKNNYAFPLVAGTTTGTAGNYTLTLDPPLTALTPGLTLNVNFHTAMITSMENRLNVNGLGAKIIARMLDGAPYGLFNTAPAAGVHTLMYDGTFWLMRDPVCYYGGGVEGSLTPDRNSSYDLGTSSKPWRNIVGSNGTFYNSLKYQIYDVWHTGSLQVRSWTPTLLNGWTGNIEVQQTGNLLIVTGRVTPPVNSITSSNNQIANMPGDLPVKHAMEGVMTCMGDFDATRAVQISSSTIVAFAGTYTQMLYSFTVALPLT